MTVKEVIADEALFRELKERFGSPFGWGEYFRGGMGAEAVRDLLEQVEPRGRGRRARAHDQELQGPEAEQGDQAPEGRVRVPELEEPARVDDPRGRAGDPAGAAPDGPARRRPVRHLRPERPLPARHQPQQPPQAAARPRRARDHREQREAHAPGGRRRPVRQRPPGPARDRAGQPRAEVPVRHAEGQAGPVPPEPARQARRLLRPFGDRRRPVAEAAPVRAAEADGAGAVQAVHHGAARRAQGGPEHQGRQEDGRVDDPRGVGRARGGHPRAPGAAEPCADAPPPRHPGLRAGAGRGQGDPDPPARLPRVQRGLRRRPDGRARSAERRGAGGGADPDAEREQHPVPGARRAARHADPGHGAGRLLPDLRARPGRAGEDRPGQGEAAPAHLPHGAGGRAGLRGQAGAPPGHRALPAGCRPPRHHDGRPDPVQRQHPARAGGDAGRQVRPGRIRVHQPDPHEAGDRHARRVARVQLRRRFDRAGAGRLQGPRVPLREPGGHHDLQERRRDPARQGADPRALRERGRRRSSRSTTWA